jgi:hypothetical protein
MPSLEAGLVAFRLLSSPPPLLPATGFHAPGGSEGDIYALYVVKTFIFALFSFISSFLNVYIVIALKIVYPYVEIRSNQKTFSKK